VGCENSIRMHIAPYTLSSRGVEVRSTGYSGRPWWPMRRARESLPVTLVTGASGYQALPSTSVTSLVEPSRAGHQRPPRITPRHHTLRPRSTRTYTPISSNTYEYAEDHTSLDADIGAMIRKLIRKSTEFPLVSADIAVVNTNLQFGEDISQGAPVSKP
jgi:hypothetical protein